MSQHTPRDRGSVGAVVEFEKVTKRYTGGKGEPAAVQELSMTIPGGEICALVGPSGCGKTTTLKMVNRLVEPSSGRILLDGEDIGRGDPVELRRGIGYVIQQTGLFPHRTIGDNVATVPGLLGWDKKRIRKRVDELIELVGLDPATYRDRYPVQLSGGERQRIGVARAIAVDPPVLLMDEPFGAVDPITRERLQNEFLRLQQRQLSTTILFVTHDIDEAIKMGNRVAVFKPGGKLAQFDTAETVLDAPADEFVARFVGSDRGLKRLSLSRVRDVPLEHPVTVRVGTDATEIERQLDRASTPYVLMVDEQERPVGWLWRQDLGRGPVGPERASSPEPLLDPDSTLRDALSSMLGSAVQEGLVVDADGRLLGSVSIEAVGSVLRREAATSSR